MLMTFPFCSKEDPRFIVDLYTTRMHICASLDILKEKINLEFLKDSWDQLISFQLNIATNMVLVVKPIHLGMSHSLGKFSSWLHVD